MGDLRLFFLWLLVGNEFGEEIGGVGGAIWSVGAERVVSGCRGHGVERMEEIGVGNLLISAR